MSEASPVDQHDSAEAAPSAAIWTVPNLISMARIVLIVVFGWLLIAGHDAWAIGALAAAGISDFLDGYLARRWNQVTELGRVLDPAADRLLTIVVVLGLAIRGVIPWWLVAILLARDVMVGVALLIARSRGVSSAQVTFVGKAATFGLYVTLPLAFLAYERWDGVWVAAIVGACVAAALYWISGIGYARDLARRAHPASDGASVAGAPERLG
ncbi:CDP-alcohol phosphatidyltransferase family protein [Demequina activiva]|uniref:CDP-diacylglycerol--glycerol-3-phosphate 3-phosphatidyltransferase n=1 Tax=Demequina activiva TaxID=1582364 RepID=A0A919Q2T7_9MICO|nr:CDP-alcohol phosphatidyltransferase family protein [Demequina activiva]GIG54569.1 CDP-diacylglycerol--glycerol-3-phosphate 3-phosphatidyltransferase [Demequina activiva]